MGIFGIGGSKVLGTEAQKNKIRIVGIVSGLGISVLLAAITILVIRKTGLYPRGYDTMYHIYRGESLFQALQNKE